MSKYECYPVACRPLEEVLYFIYCSGDQDFVVSQNGLHLAFKNMNSLSNYVIKNKIGILQADQCVEYDFEILRQFLAKRELSVDDSKELMDWWNLLDDISRDNKLKWSLFIEKSSNLRMLHEKLLFDSNIFNYEDFNPQKWSQQEIFKLQELFRVGFNSFVENMTIYE